MFRKELINTETDTTILNTDVNTKIEKGMITMFKNKTMRFLTIATVAGVLAFTPAVAKAPELNNTVVTETVANAAAKNIETKYFRLSIPDNTTFSNTGYFSIEATGDYNVYLTLDGSEPGIDNTIDVHAGDRHEITISKDVTTIKFKVIKAGSNGGPKAYKQAKVYTKHYNIRVKDQSETLSVSVSGYKEGYNKNKHVTVNDFETKYINGTMVCRDQAEIKILNYDKDSTTATPVTYTLDGNTHTVKANTRKEIIVKTPGKHTFSYINPETGEKIVKNFYVDTMTIKSKKGKHVGYGDYRINREIVGYKYYDAVFYTVAFKPGKDGTETNFELKNDKVVKADGSTFTIDETGAVSLITTATFTVKAGQKLNVPYDKLQKYGFNFCD